MSKLNESTLQGKVIFKGSMLQITERMTKQEIVIEYQRGQRVEMPKIDFVNPGNSLDGIEVGMEVFITYYPSGNRDKRDSNRYYTSLTGVNIQILK